MIGEIIAIGNELTSGRILNTNSRFAAGQLFTAGHEIFAMATIGDTPAEIGAAIKRAITRSDFVLVTGGLGATSDDLTNQAVSEALGRQPVLYPDILEKIRSRRPKYPGQDSRQLEKLAWLPEGAELLNPDARMAGYLLIYEEKPIFFLPGVPHEMQELLADRVIPRLALLDSGAARHVRQMVFKIFGLTETEINQRLDHVEGSNPAIRMGYYPVYPEVHLSLTVTDSTSEQTGPIFKRAVAAIEEVLDDYIFGVDEDSLEGVVGRLLGAEGLSLAVAESCTGGLIAHKITSVAGSSGYFAGGVVAYSNQLKHLFLGVPEDLIAGHGAVSGQVAAAMARGARDRTGADLAVAVTGIAGPGGGTPEKPVGTVYLALAAGTECRPYLHHFAGDRWQIQEITAMTGLDLVRRHLLGKPLPRPA